MSNCEDYISSSSSSSSSFSSFSSSSFSSSSSSSSRFSVAIPIDVLLDEDEQCGFPSSFDPSSSSSSCDRHPSLPIIAPPSSSSSIDYSNSKCNVVSSFSPVYKPRRLPFPQKVIIRFEVSWKKPKGQPLSLRVCGNAEEFKSQKDMLVLEEDPDDRGLKNYWQSPEMEIKSKEGGSKITYRYCVYDDICKRVVMDEVIPKGKRRFFILPTINGLWSVDSGSFGDVKNEDLGSKMVHRTMGMKIHPKYVAMPDESDEDDKYYDWDD